MNQTEFDIQIPTDVHHVMVRFVEQELQIIVTIAGREFYGRNEKMIVHIPLNAVATLTVGITDQMQQDLIRCRKAFEDTGNGPEGGCENCSWNSIEYNDMGMGMCEDQRIIDAVMAAGKDKNNG